MHYNLPENLENVDLYIKLQKPITYSIIGFMAERKLSDLFSQAPRSPIETVSQQQLERVDIEIDGRLFTFYVDDTSAALSARFDLSQFPRLYGTQLGDHSLERQLAPYVAFPVALGAVVGIAETDHHSVQNALRNLPWPLDQGGRAFLRPVIATGATGIVNFPTTELFDAFYFPRIDPNLSDAQFKLG